MIVEHTAVCIASGPSLTAEDCETVRQMALPTIAANTSFRRALWADAVYAMDRAWWTEYHEEVAATFHGERYCWSKMAEKYGATVTDGMPGFIGFRNSGANAVSLAITAGAREVLLLGFDCQRTGGQSHWHGDHPNKLSNARSLGEWPSIFKRLADYAKRKEVRVVNCSRQTALKCFERGTL